MRRLAAPPLAFLLLCLHCGPAVRGASVPVEFDVRERFDWKDAADVRVSLRQGEMLFLSRWRDGGGAEGSPPAAAVSLPYVQAGPVFGRGMFRLASDPLGFSAWSGVFRETTSLVLDSSLSSSWQGVVLTPLPGKGALFARQREEGSESGAYLRVPLGSGAAAEGMVLGSRPLHKEAAEEWFLASSPFPGGDMTHLAGRLCVESPRFDFSFTMLGSSPQRAAPGSAASLWVRTRSSETEESLLVSAASTAYRLPAGPCVTSGSQVSAAVRLGRDPGAGTIMAGGAFTAGRPEFAPHREIPSRTLLRLDVSRDFAARPGIPLSVLFQADKEIVRDAEGVNTEEARCGCTLCAFPDGIAVKAGGGLSDHEGASLSAGITLDPGSRLRALIEMKAAGLGAVSPSVSAGLTLTLRDGASMAALHLGVDDYPLRAGGAPGPLKFLRLSLSTSIKDTVGDGQNATFGSGQNATFGGGQNATFGGGQNATFGGGGLSPTPRPG